MYAGSPKRNRAESPPLHASDYPEYRSLTANAVEVESLSMKIIAKHVMSKFVVGEMKFVANLREKEVTHLKYG